VDLIFKYIYKVLLRMIFRQNFIILIVYRQNVNLSFHAYVGTYEKIY
jgi:hypothetical protein